MTLTELYAELDEKEIELDYFKFDGIEAMSIPGSIAINPDKVVNSADEKVKIVHEFGHNETGSFYNSKNPLDIKAKHERRANKWAIQKLVTEDELHNAVLMGYYEIWELAEYFNITEDFMLKIVCFYEGLEW